SREDLAHSVRQILTRSPGGGVRETVGMDDSPVDRAQPNVGAVSLVGVCIDAADGESVAAFYAGLLGWDITASDDNGWFQLHDPDGHIALNIQQEAGYEPPVWPERSAQQQKMMHLEIEVQDLERSLHRAVALGGVEAPFQPPDRDRDRLRVVLDPAGHPLCLFIHGE
ncbi:MAG: VOC family protein, partial [Ilumatobacteraceae bacterium]